MNITSLYGVMCVHVCVSAEVGYVLVQCASTSMDKYVAWENICGKYRVVDLLLSSGTFHLLFFPPMVYSVINIHMVSQWHYW